MIQNNVYVKCKDMDEGIGICEAEMHLLLNRLSHFLHAWENTGSGKIRILA